MAFRSHQIQVRKPSRYSNFSRIWKLNFESLSGHAPSNSFINTLKTCLLLRIWNTLMAAVVPTMSKPAMVKVTASSRRAFLEGISCQPLLGWGVQRWNNLMFCPVQFPQVHQEFIDLRFHVAFENNCPEQWTDFHQHRAKQGKYFVQNGECMK